MDTQLIPQPALLELEWGILVRRRSTKSDGICGFCKEDTQPTTIYLMGGKQDAPSLELLRCSCLACHAGLVELEYHQLLQYQPEQTHHSRYGKAKSLIDWWMGRAAGSIHIPRRLWNRQPNSTGKKTHSTSLRLTTYTNSP